MDGNEEGPSFVTEGMRRLVRMWPFDLLVLPPLHLAQLDRQRIGLEIDEPSVVQPDDARNPLNLQTAVRGRDIQTDRTMVLSDNLAIDDLDGSRRAR